MCASVISVPTETIWAGLCAFGDTTEDTANFNGGPVKGTGQDSLGAYFDVGITSAAQNVGIIILKGNVKDPGPNEFLDPATQGSEYWQLSGSNVLHATQPPTIQQTDLPIPAGKARIHYHRPDSDYSVWNLFPFFATTDPNSDFCGTNDFVAAYNRIRQMWRLLRYRSRSHAVEMAPIVHSVRLRASGPNLFHA
jgi:pullulanase